MQTAIEPNHVMKMLVPAGFCPIQVLVSAGMMAAVSLEATCSAAIS